MGARCIIRSSALAVHGMCLMTLVSPAAAQPSDDSLVRNSYWPYGNANLKGRIASIDALEKDWTHVIVGTASGGVFESVNGGRTWTPIFDTYDSASDRRRQAFPAQSDHHLGGRQVNGRTQYRRLGPRHL